MGYLEELKRQADDVLAQQRQDIGALQRNTLLTDAACQTTARYLATLARQLNVLQPVSKRSGASTAARRSASSASAISAPIRA